MQKDFVFTKDRALFIKKEKILILGDLHIGFEYEIFSHGISIPSQTKKILNRILKLIDVTRAKKLVLLGDIKHNIPVFSKQEERELPLFFNSLSEKVETIVVKGNHDGNIEKFVGEDVKVYQSDGFRYKMYGFLHGHAWMGKDIEKSKILFLAHEHPAIEFRDKYIRTIEPVWIVTKPLEKFYERFEKSNISEVVFFPAFNHLIGGIAFNKKGFKPMGPNAKLMDIKNGDVYLHDGIYLGKLKDLKVYEE